MLCLDWGLIPGAGVAGMAVCPPLVPLLLPMLGECQGMLCLDWGLIPGAGVAGMAVCPPLVPLLLPMLVPQTQQPSAESFDLPSVSVEKLLSKMKGCVDTYASRLKSVLAPSPPLCLSVCVGLSVCVCVPRKRS